MKRFKVWFYDIPKYQYQEDEDAVNNFLSKINERNIVDIRTELNDDEWRIAIIYMVEVDEPVNPQ